MRESEQATRVVRFGVFEVDFHTTELRKQGVRIRLPGQSFQVLQALLLRPGELVTREELKQKLWPSDSFGDFEHGLNAAVNRVREALGDSSDSPRFVETLPRRGYRFIAPVEQMDSEGKKTLPEATATPPQNGQTPTRADTTNQPPPVPRPRWIQAVAFVLLPLVAVGTFLFIRLRNRPSSPSRAEVQENLRVTPLTTLPGQEISPSFSPDGSQVVFAWDGGNSSATNPFNLFVKAIGSEKVDQLTHDPGGWIVPAWSPDGSTIAFARQGGTEGVFSIPARGGPERKLADAVFSDGLTLNWSPDGGQLLYATKEGLRILNPGSGEVRSLDTGRCESSSPAFSPDGKWIAFGCQMSGIAYLDILSTKGGTSKHLIRPKGCTRFAWTNDSQRIVADGLWEIDIHGGEPRRLKFADNAGQPAIAARSDRLAFVEAQYTTNIWTADARTGSSRGVFAPATVEQRNAHISPDGKRIAFESSRSGSKEIWVANVDGSDAVQLSNFHSHTGTPRWSPDGRTILFDSRTSGKAALYLVDPATALPRQISTNGIPADDPSWSADGKWIYFHSESPEPAEHDAIYRVTPQGGTPERMAHARGYKTEESKDGKLLYFAADYNNAAIYVLNIATGEQRPLADMPKLGCGNDWVLSSKGIFFVDFGQQPGIDFFDFSSHRVTKKILLNKQPAYWGGLSLSPDESWLTYSQTDEAGSDLMLVEGFR